MNVSAWSIRNPIPALMLFVMLTFAGVLSFKAMKVQNFPDLDLPTITVVATLPGGGKAEVTADGGVTVNGPLTVNGDTTINGETNVSKTLTAATDVIGGGKSLKGHKHTGVQTGGGMSGPPQ